MIAACKNNANSAPSSISKPMDIKRSSSGSLCDFTIQVGGATFRVHKFVLASASEYFRAMFSHDTVETKHNWVCLDGVSLTAMEAIIEYCYTTEICLNNENVQDILVTATRLHMADIQAACVEYISQRVEISNCLAVLSTASHCELPELRQLAFSFCLSKFEQIAEEEEEFLRLDEHLLAELISHDHLVVRTEETVFEALIKWYEGDAAHRLDKLDSLMNHVRFSRIKLDKLKTLAGTAIVQKLEKCRRWIEEAEIIPPLNWLSFVEPRFRPRGRSRYIYAVGGQVGRGSIASVERYDTELHRWDEVKPMSTPRSEAGVAIIENSLYVFGGYITEGGDDLEKSKCVERFDILKGEWVRDVADMKEAFYMFAVVTLNNYIYAIGYKNDNEIVGGVMQRYDPVSNTWEFCRPPLGYRYRPDVVVLDGRIYLIGQQLPTYADRVCHRNSVECYDPTEDRWTYKRGMSLGGHGADRVHCFTYVGKIYAVENKWDYSSRRTECYDPKLDQWKPSQIVDGLDRYLKLVQVNDLIYAVGYGCVCVYDPIRKTVWVSDRNQKHFRTRAGYAVY